MLIYFNIDQLSLSSFSGTNNNLDDHFKCSCDLTRLIEGSCDLTILIEGSCDLTRLIEGSCDLTRLEEGPSVCPLNTRITCILQL